jgi:hypothetical protein
MYRDSHDAVFFFMVQEMMAAFYVHELKACPLQGFDHFFSGYPG